MTNVQAIEYINSLISNYDCAIAVDKHDPNYRLCNIWISENDLLALRMAKDALKRCIEDDTDNGNE